MKRDLRSRLNKLAFDVMSIGNFNYSSEYNNKVEKIQDLAKRISENLPLLFTNKNSGCYPVLDIGRNLESPIEINPVKLKTYEGEVKKILETLHKDFSYNLLLEAYNEDNQTKIEEFLPYVFTNNQLDRIYSQNKNTPKLFHGVTMREGTTIEDYLNLVLRIQKQGLKPSPYGTHVGMDEFIRPVFAANKHEEAHGLLYFSFIPANYTVVVNGRESTVYTKLLKANMDLWIRDAELIEVNRPDDLNISTEEAKKHLLNLEKLLQDKKIKYEKTPSDIKKEYWRP